MPFSDILTKISTLSTSTQQLLSFVDSKKTGNTFHSPGGSVRVELNLNKNDFDKIFQDLTKMGTSVQKITQDFRKISQRSDVHDNTQSLIDNHAMSLATITAIMQGQVPQSDYGNLFPPLQGLNSAIMNLQQTAIILNSYSSTSKSTDKSTSKTPPKTPNIKLIASIIVAVILTIGGVSAYNFSINIDDNSNDEQSVSNFGSPNSNTEIDPNVDVVNSPNSSVTIEGDVDVEGDATFNYGSSQENPGISVQIIAHTHELITEKYPAMIFPNGTVIHKEATITSDGLALYENESAKFTIFVYNGGSQIEKLDRYTLKVLPDNNIVQPLTRNGNFEDIVLVPQSEPHEINVEFMVTSDLAPSGIIKFELFYGTDKIDTDPIKYEIFKTNPFKSKP